MDASYRRRRPLAPSKAPYLLYAGLVVFGVLMALTIRELQSAWHQARARSRAEAVFDLVQVRTPTRPTDKPGAIAWLDHQMRRYEESRAEGETTARTADRLSVTADPGPVPAILAPVAQALVDALDGLTPIPTGALRVMDDEEVRPEGVAPSEGHLQFRSRYFLDFQLDFRLDLPLDERLDAPDRDPSAGLRGDVESRWFVLTRRSAFGTPGHGENASDRFLRWAAPYLEAARGQIAALEPISGKASASLIRIYALAEDGTFLSLPWLDPAAKPDLRRAVTWQEGLDLRRSPQLPNFVTNEFFFRFDFDHPRGQDHHSGLYLDVGGHGLVTTITVPVGSPDHSFRAVIAIDLALPIDWPRFAASVEPPLIAHLTELEAPGSDDWQPWSALAQAIASQEDAGEVVPPRLAQALADLAAKESETGAKVPTSAQYHRVVPKHGALAVFQAAQRDWLMVFFPEVPTRFPILAVSLLALLGLMLLGGFELNRRRAEAAQQRAEHELRERQSLLNAMRIPIAVVDPNTDLVVSSNEAAAAIGIVTDSCIGDLVTGDDGREHYERMQRARGERRRAYGVPLAIAQDDGTTEHRLALIRSIAITSPIDSFQADERHRLGILFLVEPECDLPLYTRGIEQATRADERRHLAGLLAHGVDTLIHALAARLEQAGDHDACARWLADYLGRRVRLTAWLLDHWHASPPLPPETTLEASQLHATLTRLEEVFAQVRDDPALRARLHWSNGLLAQPTPERPNRNVFDLDIDWPEGVLFTLPARGGAGLFLEEVLINAIRHGRPGTRPQVAIRHEPVRRELIFTISNQVDTSLGQRPEIDRKPYGGIAIVTRLAHLFGWRNLRFEPQEGHFVASWRIPVSERAAPGDSD